MYKQLALKNFKAFRELELELRPLTLLSGMNGMGKSSILQALLLLRQSYLGRKTDVSSDGRLQLILQGELVELGTGYDVFYEGARASDVNELSLSLIDENIGLYAWLYNYERGTSDVLMPSGFDKAPKDMYLTSLFTDDFHYLQAERVGPRTAFTMSDHAVRERRKLGKTGEYAFHFLSVWSSDRVLEEMHHESETDEKLGSQITAWIGEISPGAQMSVTPYATMDVVNLQYTFPGMGARYIRATNVGFGITYTLPVLVALLSARPGYLILLENPEAHLHPKGQSRLGELIARAASAGVQVIVETHSDHVLNGIRVATKKGNINSTDVAIHHFGFEEGHRTYYFLEMDADGGVSRWPEAFFDEYEKRLFDLL